MALNRHPKVLEELSPLLKELSLLLGPPLHHQLHLMEQLVWPLVELNCHLQKVVVALNCHPKVLEELSLLLEELSLLLEELSLLLGQLVWPLVELHHLMMKNHCLHFQPHQLLMDSSCISQCYVQLHQLCKWHILED